MENKITYLDFVIPLCCVYSSGLFFWAYFIKDDGSETPLTDVAIIFITSTVFCYGILALSILFVKKSKQ